MVEAIRFDDVFLCKQVCLFFFAFKYVSQYGKEKLSVVVLSFKSVIWYCWMPK